MALGLTRAEVVHVAGNACSVPVIGSVLVQVLLACQPVLLSGSPQRPPTAQASNPLQKLRAATVSTEIAWLQAETSVLKRERELVEEATRACIRRCRGRA